MITHSTIHMQVWAMQLVEPVLEMAAWDVGQHTLHQGAHTRVVLIPLRGQMAVLSLVEMRTEIATTVAIPGGGGEICWRSN